MPRHERSRSKSGYYHIMIRGNERKNIFLDDEDRLRFIKIIHDKKQDGGFFVHAFCLMDNHVHLMLSEGKEDVATVMKRINVSYVSYFNKKYRRVGHLFQDRFKSELIEDDAYVLALVRYIHRNPIKAGMVNMPEEYKWSSYLSFLEEDDYIGRIVDRDLILEMISEDRERAEKQFTAYMNEEAQEEFLDIREEINVMDEKKARELFEEMLLRMGKEKNSETSLGLPEELVKEFRGKTNLSIRKIAEITGMNKDKVNKILKR